MATVKIKSGRSWATVSGPAAAELEAAVRAAMGPAIARVEAEMERVKREHIAQDWPVRTGKSRDAWEIVVKIDPARFKAEVSLDNPYEYVRYLKSTKEGKDQDATRLRSPLQTDVRKPVTEAKKTLSPEIGKILADYLNGKVFDG